MGKADDFETLQGHIEIDETLIGGRGTDKGTARKMENKTIVMGIKQCGGPMVTETIPDASTGSLRPHIERIVEKGSAISTDEWTGYKLLKNAGYDHKAVNHAPSSGGSTTTAAMNIITRTRLRASGSCSLSAQHAHSHFEKVYAALSG